MARRRSKRRTHVAVANPNKSKTSAAHNPRANTLDPQSMVIRIGAGEVGSSVSQLVADVRRVMEPGTASRLKERRGNKLRDYTTMCGPLGVTHLLLFSRSPAGNINLRITLPPRGPTLHFRVEKYSLSKDVQRVQRRPKGGGKEFVNPPLLVMNNFSTAADSKAKVPKHLESLATTVFQSLFPPINPQTTPLKSIRRVLLLNREQPREDTGSFIVNFRHYAIGTKATGMTKPLKRLDAAERLSNANKTKRGGLPNLGKLQDISDYMIGGETGEGYMTDGGTSGSEAETDAEVEVLESVPRKVLSAKVRAAMAAEREDGKAMPVDVANDKVERRAVRLAELGPRMRLRLIKVEEGLCQGQVMWHELIHKSKEEIKELQNKWDKRNKEKAERRKKQNEDVERKKKAKAESGKGATQDEEGNDDGMDLDDDDLDSDLYDDELDSEGLGGDAEMEVNERMDEAGDWEDEADEIAGGG